MSTAGMLVRLTEASPRLKSRLAGVFYLLTFVTGISALLFNNGRFAANVLADLSYVAVTLIFYDLFKPVNRSLSLLAAAFSLAGCVVGVLSAFHLARPPLNSLVFFGFYCLLIGYLILRSAFVPRILGALMAFGGLGWLAFLSPPLAHLLLPYNMAPGILGEGALTIWLLAVGVNEGRWKEQARATKDHSRETRAIEPSAKDGISVSRSVTNATADTRGRAHHTVRPASEA